MKHQWNWRMIISGVLIAGLLLLIITPAAALSVREENYQKILDSFVLIEQLNGTEVTSAEFMETVLLDIYVKISPEYQKKLSEIPHS